MRVPADARPAGDPQGGDPAGGGAEVVVGVLGVDPALERVADGRVFTGRQGVALKLVDEIGDEKTAVAWLAKEKNIDPKTPVRDYRLRDRLSDLPFLHTAAIVTLDALGLGTVARQIEAHDLGSLRLSAAVGE